MAWTQVTDIAQRQRGTARSHRHRLTGTHACKCCPCPTIGSRDISKTPKFDTRPHAISGDNRIVDEANDSIACPDHRRYRDMPRMRTKNECTEDNDCDEQTSATT
jgi:hypothetical protein